MGAEMRELIYRDEAIEAVRDCLKHIVMISKQNRSLKREGAFAIDTMGAINDLPSVQPERKKGEWYRLEDEDLWVCSNCGEKVCCRGKFCPNCGADMRGGEEK